MHQPEPSPPRVSTDPAEDPYGSDMPDGLLFTEELSKLLRVSPNTIRRWRREGKIRPALITVGGQARWDLEQVREQLRKLHDKS